MAAPSVETSNAAPSKHRRSVEATVVCAAPTVILLSFLFFQSNKEIQKNPDTCTSTLRLCVHIFFVNMRKKGKKARVGKLNKKDVCKRLDLLV